LAQYDYNLEYTALHSGTHRRPPARIGAPGVCRFFNLWLPNYPDRPDAGRFTSHPLDIEFTRRRQLWVSKIDELIWTLVDFIATEVDTRLKSELKQRSFNCFDHTNLYLFQHVLVEAAGGWQKRPIFRRSGSGETPTAVDFEPSCICCSERLYGPEDVKNTTEKFPARFQNFSLNFWWNTFWVKLRVTLHNEYASFGFYIDLSGSDPSSAEYGKGGISKDVKVALETIERVSGKRLVDIASHGSSWRGRNNLDRVRLKPSHNTLYDKVWEDLDRQVLLEATRRTGTDSLWVQAGSIVYDARILLLHCQIDHEKPATDHPAPIYSHAYHAKRAPLESQIALNRPFTEVEAVRYTDSVMPLISANSSTDDARVEYTASSFLGDRVIYISSLAAEHIDNSYTTVPVKSLLVCRPYQSWQLGRLVDRLCLLGSVRVAALYNLGELDKAGDALRVLTRLVQTTAASIRSYADRNRALGQTLARYREETAKLGQKCDGGFEYRIERSRYYVQQFNDIISTFRLNYVQGFQRYDYFIKRRLYSTFEFISRLGVRMERHKRDLDWLGRQVQINYNHFIQRYRVLARYC
jgi:hypothetical protein